jgi:hypothetical protein
VSALPKVVLKNHQIFLIALPGGFLMNSYGWHFIFLLFISGKEVRGLNL